MSEQRKKVVLAYSGGLDTSVAIKWIPEKYNMDVVTVTIDLGAVKDLDAIRKQGLKRRLSLMQRIPLSNILYFLPCSQGHCTKVFTRWRRHWAGR